MKTVTDYPRAIREIENTWIPLADGTRLAARIWLPVDAEQNPVPAILEYLPYRKDDGTTARDAITHPYFAGHGYASMRVDKRGSGDADGLLMDEYLKQEQDDALEVMAWIAAQPWSTGAVGIIGISWGGFNGLQIAARRPPELKAIISICSTDDRYTDDCHYMGGCVLGSDMLGWASAMFAYNAYPPDPRFVGDRWREMWFDRMQHTPPFVEAWLEPSTARRLLEARLGHRGLLGDHLPRIYGGRLGRPLHQQHSARAGRLAGPPQGPDRALGASLPAHRRARSGHRIPAGVPALVGLLDEGAGHRHHG